MPLVAADDDVPQILPLLVSFQLDPDADEAVWCADVHECHTGLPPLHDLDV